MGNTFSGRKPFKIKRKKSVDGCSKCHRFIYVDTIRDANFSWLEGRRVSADDFFPIARQVEGVRNEFNEFQIFFFFSYKLKFLINLMNVNFKIDRLGILVCFYYYFYTSY